MSLQPGRTLSRYRLVEPIGAGGMGVVWKAVDTRLDREVALKVIAAEIVRDEGARLRFRREAHALSRLNHPGIAAVYDFDTHDGIDFLVMEYVPGRTLADILRHGALPESQVVDLGRQVADALGAAHARGVLHRDLKPANLRITPEGRLKILDFGLAKLVPVDPSSRAETGTVTGGVVGTQPYMAPEQLRGGAVDARTDLYAAGVVLYEMATGTRPFRQGLSTALVDAILHEDPSPPRSLASGISGRLDTAILKCLEKDPGRRPASAGDLAADLESIAKDAASSAARPHSRARLARWMLLAAASAAIAVSLTWMLRPHGAAPVSPQRKIMLVVLPFENLSADPEQEYFSDGLTEEMIARLGPLAPGSLGVIARTSAMHYKKTTKTIDEIGHELGVQYALEGSVRRASGRVRITAQLIELDDQTHLWAETYERDGTGIFAVQSEVAQRIASSLALELLPGAKGRPDGDGPVAPEAHEAYLRGMFDLNTREPARIPRAIASLERAVEIEPTYARAHAALADAYGVASQHATLTSAAEEDQMLSRETAALARARTLAPDLPEVHLQLAEEKFYHAFDWENAEHEYLLAIAANPSDARAHHYYATYLTSQRRFDEALRQEEESTMLDPLGPTNVVGLAGALSNHGRTDDAIGKYREALALSPGFANARKNLAVLLLRAGRTEEAIGEFSRWLVDSGEGQEVPALEGAIRTGGFVGFQRWNLQHLRDLSRRQFVSPVDLAGPAAASGQHDLAISLLEEAYRRRDWRLVYLPYTQTFDGLRSDPHFRDLMTRLRLPVE